MQEKHSYALVPGNNSAGPHAHPRCYWDPLVVHSLLLGVKDGPQQLMGDTRLSVPRTRGQGAWAVLQLAVASL